MVALPLFSTLSSSLRNVRDDSFYGARQSLPKIRRLNARDASLGGKYCQIRAQSIKPFYLSAGNNQIFPRLIFEGAMSIHRLNCETLSLRGKIISRFHQSSLDVIFSSSSPFV
jgi:hypothetical protein